jgi:ABC-type transport system involved in cytochrome bd biosynthesis fused ATPase/permease subunit
MQTIAPIFAIFFAMAVYAFVLWIAWKFYCALARIGEELAQIKNVLQQRLPLPAAPPRPTLR